MGRVKGHAIFMATADPELVALGRFPDANAYPKIVTVLDLSPVSDRIKVVEKWMSRFRPALLKARQGLMTPLHRVIYDAESANLLLLSEHVEDARFGQHLAEQNLELEEAFGLGYLVCKQVQRLHENGLAHNNVCAEALLLKGIKDSRRVHPAMVGIVEPTESEADMRKDARKLAELLMTWVSEPAIGGAPPAMSARLTIIASDLQEIASEEALDSSVATVIELCEDALSGLDFNFGVLRENGGNLNAYALLLVSHSLYGRLWI
jgi:hypothetical protein